MFTSGWTFPSSPRLPKLLQLLTETTRVSNAAATITAQFISAVNLQE